jgi:hypothetical protein
MQSIRSGAIGPRPTSKYRCELGFYDLKQPGGNFAKLFGLSNITHVGPIIHVPASNDLELCLVLVTGGVKLCRSEVLERGGAVLLHRVDMGEVDLNLDDLFHQASGYCDTTLLDCLFWYFFGRFIGLTRPRVCTTFVCDMFKLKECWEPATLYRRLKK